MKWIIITIIFLAGCSNAKMNDSIIIEKDKCLKADMDYEQYGWEKESIRCVKKAKR
jgi:hypothetical protein